MKQHPASNTQRKIQRAAALDVRCWLLDVFLLSLFAISAHGQAAATMNIQVNQTSDGNFHFAGTGAAGVTYELDAATNLAPPILWMFVTNAVAGQNGLFDLWDLSATNFPQRYYRIISNQ
jgi:hypothetical protein